MMVQVDVFWVVTRCNVVVGYQRFRGPCCFHLSGCDAVYVVTGHQRFRYFTTTLHGVITQKTSTWNNNSFYNS